MFFTSNLLLVIINLVILSSVLVNYLIYYSDGLNFKQDRISDWPAITRMKIRLGSQPALSV